MTKKRSAAEIIYSILNACRERTNKTKIMYASALNFAELKKYLEILVKNGYLKEEQEGKSSYYSITEEGNKLLQILERYVKIIEEKKELETQLQDVLSKFKE